MVWPGSPKTSKYQVHPERVDKNKSKRTHLPKNSWTSRRRQEVADISTHWAFPRNKRLAHWEPVLFSGHRLPSHRRSPTPPRSPSIPPVHTETYSARRAEERKQPKASRQDTPSPLRSPRYSPSPKLLAPKQAAISENTSKNLANVQLKPSALRAIRSDMVAPTSPTNGSRDVDVRQCISARDVLFLGASWLLSRPDQWKVVRCQDLPAEAFIDPSYAAWLYDKLGGLVILSCPWLTKAHPDPHGFHFRSLRMYLRKHRCHFLKIIRPSRECFEDIGLFWDFASLPQPSVKTGERSGQEQQMFTRGLKTVEFLYSGAFTIVVQLKHMPQEPFENMNRTPYDNRGWCYFEEILGVTLKSGFQLLNLALASDRLEDSSDWQLVASASQCDCRPPIHPEHLRQELVYKIFSVGSDFDVLMAKYSDYFYSTVPSALEINLAHQSHIVGARSWGPKEVDSLVRSLPELKSLMKLNLRGRSFGDTGAEKLAKALPNLTQLQTLWLHNCDIGNKGISALAPALRELHDLRDLRLHGCRFRESGLRELCDITFFPTVDNIESSEKAGLLKDMLKKSFHSRGSIENSEEENALSENLKPGEQGKNSRSFLRLAHLEDLTLPLELARTITADTIDRLVKTNTVQRSRLIVKWLPGQAQTSIQHQHVT